MSIMDLIDARRAELRDRVAAAVARGDGVTIAHAADESAFILALMRDLLAASYREEAAAAVAEHYERLERQRWITG